MRRNREKADYPLSSVYAHTIMSNRTLSRDTSLRSIRSHSQNDLLDGGCDCDCDCIDCCCSARAPQHTELPPHLFSRTTLVRPRESSRLESGISDDDTITPIPSRQPFVSIQLAKRADQYGRGKLPGYIPILLDMGTALPEPPVFYVPSQVHPIIAKNGHGMHAVIAADMYTHPEQRRRTIDRWILVTLPKYNTERFCFYVRGERAIFGCRGTQDMADVLQDWHLIREAGGCGFGRVDEAISILDAFRLEFREIKIISITGHSLGGAVARCVSARTGLVAVAFNPAAPPTTQTVQPHNNVTYHIVMDTISAWISGGNVVRLDTGIRIAPSTPLAQTVQTFLSYVYPIVGLAWVARELYQTVAAHSKSQFFLQSSQIVPTALEDKLWQDWWGIKLPPQKQLIRTFLLGTTWGSSAGIPFNWQLPHLVQS